MHLLLYFLVLLSLSQAANLIRLASAPIEVIGTYRMAVASLLMLTLALASCKSVAWPKTIKSWLLLVSSGLFFFTHLWTYGFAAQNTYIAMGMIVFSANPLFTALGNYLFFGEKFTPRLWIAYIMAAAGLYLLVTQESLFQNHSSASISFNPVVGNTSAIISAVLYSAYVLTGKGARRLVENSVYTTVAYSVVALGFFLTGVARGISFVGYPPLTWGAIAGLVIFPTLMGHALFTYLLKHMNVNVMSCGKLAEPIMSALVAFLLFGETITRETVLAFACTSTAVLILFAPAPLVAWLEVKTRRLIHRGHDL